MSDIGKSPRVSTRVVETNSDHKLHEPVSILHSVSFDWLSFTLDYSELVEALRLLRLSYPVCSTYFDLPYDEIKSGQIADGVYLAKYNNQNSSKRLTVSVRPAGIAQFMKRSKVGLPSLCYLLKLNVPSIIFTRVDVAFDLINHPEYDLDFFIDEVKAHRLSGGLITPSKRVRIYEDYDLHDLGSTSGKTIYIGANIHKSGGVRIYDKLAEQQSRDNDLPDGVLSWVRIELERVSEQADEMMRQLSLIDESAHSSFLCELLLGQLDFRAADDSNLNKARWFSRDWWIDIVGTLSARKLSVPRVTPSYSRLHQWFLKTAVGALAVITAVEGDQVVRSMVIDAYNHLSTKNHNILDSMSRKIPKLDRYPVDILESIPILG